ncbi:MAG: DinB family protein [Ignavibacteriales bacterium]|nr:MAG: DinB family protein [Ignavibacteriales bacterium]
MQNFKHLLTLLFICAFLQNVSAQSSPEGNSDDNAFFNELVGQLHFIEGRLVSLAEAMPEEKFNWNPAEGVRSVGEVYSHAGGANYFLLSYLGGKMPEGFSPDYEKTVTKKSDIISMLKSSFEYARNFIPTLKAEDLDKEVELPFGKFTQRSVLFIVITHGHEHLGQSIAYARMNGVTPPWSE